MDKKYLPWVPLYLTPFEPTKKNKVRKWQNYNVADGPPYKYKVVLLHRDWGRPLRTYYFQNKKIAEGKAIKFRFAPEKANKAIVRERECWWRPMGPIPADGIIVRLIEVDWVVFDFQPSICSDKRKPDTLDALKKRKLVRILFQDHEISIKEWNLS
tara:strand:+ start:111 stop:578 length:468 start_codon:yes stop_codon:yes gene_type:complete